MTLETIDLSRKVTRHMAFGVGVHRCLGSNLARVMFKTMITELLRRAPDLAVRTSEVVRYADAGPVYGVRHLPITFHPGQRKSSDSWGDHVGHWYFVADRVWTSDDGRLDIH